ncbi:pumilio homolog 3-like [Tautogolabrus adspersus]
MKAKSNKPFSPKSGKKFTQKGKGTKLGGKSGGKKPFKPYNNAERKSRPGKGGDGSKTRQKFAFSKDGKGPQKREFPHFKAKSKEEGEGPDAKKMKKGEFKPKTKEMTKEELKKNRQQRKKDLKNSRQQAERKDMFDIICHAKRVWGELRRTLREDSGGHRQNEDVDQSQQRSQGALRGF